MADRTVVVALTEAEDEASTTVEGVVAGKTTAHIKARTRTLTASKIINNSKVKVTTAVMEAMIQPPSKVRAADLRPTSQ